MAKQRRSSAGAGNVASDAVRLKPERPRRSVPRASYDLAALKYWGRGTVLNFSLSSYDQELKEMEEQSREEYIGSLRRKSTGFSRGVSKYRGVARHHHNGKWEARIGRVFGNKYLYLGTYVTQEEAAMAYDIAAIKHRGLNAATNYDASRYIKWHDRCHADDAGGLNTPCCVNDQLQPPQASPTSHAASALGPLLKSPRLKKMMERVAASQSSTEQHQLAVFVVVSPLTAITDDAAAGAEA